MTVVAAPPSAISAEPLPKTERRSWWDAPLIAWATLIFSALSLYVGTKSAGFMEADGCTHYLYARFAIREPYRFVDVWGRPVCTAIYAWPAAHFARAGTQATSLLLALATASLAYAIARGQRYAMAGLAFAFTLAQPLVFTHSFSELTELPFAVLLGIAFVGYQRRWWPLLAIAAGTLPLSRPEGFGFVLLGGAALALHRRPISLILLALPLLTWDYAGWVIYGRPGHWWQWLPAHWPYSATSLYQAGSLLHFVGLLPALVSPFLFPAMVLGTGLCLRRRANVATPSTAERRYAIGDVAIALIPLLILLVHSYLYWRGKMASNGELRYLLIAAPFWAVLAARGWAWAAERFAWRHVRLWAGAACVVPIFVNGIYQVFPLKPDASWKSAKLVADWVASQPAELASYPNLMVSHPGVFYFLDVSPTDARVREWSLATVRHAPPGTAAVWDCVYGVFNADAAHRVAEADLAAAGWVRDEEAEAILEPRQPPATVPAGWDKVLRPTPNVWHLYLSPTDIAGRATAR